MSLATAGEAQTPEDSSSILRGEVLAVQAGYDLESLLHRVTPFVDDDVVNKNPFWDDGLQSMADHALIKGYFMSCNAETHRFPFDLLRRPA